MPKQILILGALPENNYDYEKYEAIAKHFLEKGYIVKSPIDTKNFKGNYKERFFRAVKSVKNSDLIVAEMTKVSTGQGIEIGIAYELKIPIYVLAKENSKISGLIKGNPNVVKIIFYKDLEELKEKMKDFDI